MKSTTSRPSSKRMTMVALAAVVLALVLGPWSAEAQGRSCEADSDCGGSIINRQVCAEDTRVCIPASCITNAQCSNADPTKFCSGLSCESKRGEGGSCRGALGGSDDAMCLPGFGCVSGTCRQRSSTSSSASATSTSTSATSTSATRTSTTTSRSRTATATTTSESTTTSTPSATQDASQNNSSESTGVPMVVLIIGLGGAALAVLMAITMIARRRSRRNADNDFSNSHMRPFAPTTFQNANSTAAKPTAPPNMAMNASPLPQKTTNEIIEYVEVHDSHEYPTASQAAGPGMGSAPPPPMMQAAPIVTVPANPVTLPMQPQQQLYDAYGNPVPPVQQPMYAPQAAQYGYVDANGYPVDANGYPLDPNATGQVYYAAGGTPPGSSVSPAGSGYYAAQAPVSMATSPPPPQAYVPPHQQHLFTGGQQQPPVSPQAPSAPRPQGQ